MNFEFKTIKLSEEDSKKVKEIMNSMYRCKNIKTFKMLSCLLITYLGAILVKVGYSTQSVQCYLIALIDFALGCNNYLKCRDLKYDIDTYKEEKENILQKYL